MHVRHGWSGMIEKPDEWVKCSVELDEDDLRRILRAAGLGVTPDELSTADAFRLLEAEAETLVIAKLTARYRYDGQARLGELRATKDKIISQLRGPA